MPTPRRSHTLLALLATGCTTAPVAPLPQPLPETLAWAAAGSDETGGSFLGLETRENLVGGFDELDFRPGLHVQRVVESSPAARAGCRAGDVLLAFDGHATDDPETLDALLAAGEPGSSVVLEMQRGDTVFDVPVELGVPSGAVAAAEARVRHRLDPSRSRAAWLTGRGGAVLVAADDRSPFPEAGIPVGSVVVAVEGEETLSDRALIRRLGTFEPGTKVAVDHVTPDGEARTATVSLQDQERRVTRASVPILFDYAADVEGEDASFTVLDLWILSLFHYERSGEERRWSVLRFFRWSSGVGELAE